MAKRRSARGSGATLPPGGTSAPPLRPPPATSSSRRGLFRWLVEAGLGASDPIAQLTVVKPKSEGSAAWSEDVEEKFRARRSLGTRERVAFAVLPETDLLRGDAVRVVRPHPKDGVIRISAEKTGERVARAVSALLRRRSPRDRSGNLTFIASEQGADDERELLEFASRRRQDGGRDKERPRAPQGDGDGGIRSPAGPTPRWWRRSGRKERQAPHLVGNFPTPLK